MPMRNVAGGRPTQRARKIALGLLVAGLLLAMPFVRSPFAVEGLHNALESVGQLMILIGIAGRAWCTMHIGGQKFTELVTAGPFSVSRNPLYVFSLIAAFGAGLQTGSLLFATLTAFSVWIVIHATIRKEEAALGARFGEAYASYCARTPRYGPRLSSWRGQDRIVVTMPLFYGTLSDGLLFFLIVPVAELIDWLQTLGSLPVLLTLPF
ncbi:MAG: isoprenylcysteine carboxylmethyltransferase family protein [Hyphomicrobium sp.]|jgi:protein-S-isoprenylcysteine O-methyltransferase Ste14|nr:isoprenylcysteine carboxylmethyltransferase family protein [Hyphomicrobium sp.]